MNIDEIEKFMKIFKENPVKGVLIVVVILIVVILFKYITTYISKKAETDATKEKAKTDATKILFWFILITAIVIIFLIVTVNTSKKFDLEDLKNNSSTQTMPIEINQQPIVIKWQKKDEMTFSLYKLGSEEVFFNDRKQGPPLELTHLHSGIYKLLCKYNNDEHFDVFFQVK